MSVRLFPEQYFDAPGEPKAEFLGDDADVVVGTNAFVLYRTYESLERLPPLDGWEVRRLSLEGEEVNRRSRRRRGRRPLCPAPCEHRAQAET